MKNYEEKSERYNIMKYASLKYNIPLEVSEIEESKTHIKRIKSNIGDNIQTLATEQFLPKIDNKFNRDELNQVRENDKHLLIMNCWFTHMPQNWPPSESIVPVFIGFHITNSKSVINQLLSTESINYFKKHEPIGCRDIKTANLLAEKGVKTYYSNCLTLTFPKRTHIVQNGKILLVDVDDIPIPRELEEDAINMTHIFPRFLSDKAKTIIAREIIEKYNNEAKLVVTSRIHCAIPCIAFGVPVIFFGNPTDYRVTILRDFGLEIYKKPKSSIIYNFLKRIRKTVKNTFIFFKTVDFICNIYRKIFINRKVDWDPKPVSIEDKKVEMIKITRETIEKVLEKNS